MEALGCWNIFEATHDNEETKCMVGAGNKSSLYDIQGIGKITSCEAVYQNPSVLVAQSENSNLVVATDGFLTVFGDGESLHKGTINLESRIDAICFRPDGDMVIAGDSSGVIHLISMSTMKVIFSHKVIDAGNALEKNSSLFESRNMEKVFCSVTCSEDERENNGTFFIGIGLTIPKFIIFSNVNLLLLEKAHEANDIDMLRSAQLAMSMKEYDSSSIHPTRMTNLLSVSYGCAQRYLTTGNGMLGIWCEDFDPFVPGSAESNFVLEARAEASWIYQGNEVEIIKVFCLYQHIYTLDSKGGISQWNVQTLTLCQYWKNTGVKDFTITDSGLSSNKIEERLYAIVSNDVTEELEICVLQLPSLTTCFSCRCGGQSLCKVAIGPPVLEDIIYVDADISGGSSWVQLHRISEAAPEDRFLRLLSKRRFDEAEKFAQLYNLDSQQVHQQKAIHLASIIPELVEDEVAMKSTFKELMGCLEKLKDGTSVAEICLETIIPDVHMNYTLLALGQSRLSDSHHMQNGGSIVNGGTEIAEVKNDLLLQIINRMDRLVTFRVAHGCSHEDGVEWIRFCHADIPVELTRLLTSGNMSASATVLLRHKASLLAFLESPGQGGVDSNATEERLQLFLDHVPDTVDVDSLVRWLEDSLLPTLLPRISCSLKVLAAWLHRRAESYENASAMDWPENGLKMANVLFNFQNNMPGLGFMKNQLCAASRAFKSTSVEVGRLRLLASRLQLLLQLKQKYKCNVSLAEFIEETTMSLTYRMLDRVMVPELVSSVLEMTIRPYMKEHNLSEEDVLLGYVEDLLSRFRDQSWGSVESLRERKIVAIIQCITSQQVFLEATAKLAKRACVPWSDDIQSLVKKGIQIAESPLEQNGAGDLETSLEMQEKRKVLLKELKYCQHIEQLPTVLAEYGLSNIKMRNAVSQEQVVRFLIHQGTKEAFEHACHFSRTFTTISTIDLYRFRLQHLLQCDQANECLNLLLEVEKEDYVLATSLTKHMIGLAEIHLMDTEDAEDRLTYCSAAISMVEHLVRHGRQEENEELHLYFCDKLKLLTNLMALQVQCGELISVDQYMDKTFCSKLLSQKIDRYGSTSAVTTDFEITKNCSNSSSSSMMFTSTYPDQGATFVSSRFPNDTLSGSDSTSQQKPGVSLSLSHVLNVARILQVPTERLRSSIALTAAKSGINGIPTAAHLCRELLRISPTEEAADVSFQIVSEALKHVNTSCHGAMELISRVLRIAVEAIMFCKADKITDGIEMCKFYSLCNELKKITDNHGGLFTTKNTSASKDPYANVTTLHPWLEDSGGLMLQTNQVLPVFTKIIGILFNNGDIVGTKSSVSDLKRIESVIAEFRQLAFQMTSVLQGARQPQLALVWTLSCISTSLRCMANQCDPSSKDIRSLIIKQMLNTVEELNKILPDYVDDGIKTLLCCKSVDVSLVIGFLTLLPISRAQKLLQSELTKAGNNSKRIMCIASAGIATLRLNSMDAEVGKFEHLFLDARWGELLQPLQIPFDQAYFSSGSNKASTLSKLVNHPEVSGQLIREFCLDYDLDVTSALLEFTRVLLSDPSCLVTNYTERKLSEGEGVLMSIDSLRIPRVDMRVVAWENSDSKSKVGNLKSKEPNLCRPWPCVKKEMAFIMSKMREKRDLCHQLVKILRSETSPYFYKRAKYILALIAECNIVQSEVDVKKGLALIECLKLLKRSSAVSEYERQNWNFATDGRSSHKLPGIANERLPLHPLLFGDSSSAWKILTPELNEHNSTRLAPIARILSLSIDKVYMTAADNFIRSHMDKDNEHQLNLSIKQLNCVQTLTQEVKDYRMATALAKRIAELLPISDQKVQAYEWCTQLAEKWRNGVTKGDQDYNAIVSAHRNLRGLYHCVAVELILHQHKLLSDNVAVLTSSPEKLILVLHQHPSIVKRYYKPDGEDYPDIHEAANKIADIHSLNIFKLRMSFSMEWLLSANCNQEQSNEEDSTVNLANMRAKSIVDSDNETGTMNADVIRLLYVLSYMATKQTAKFLLGFAFDRKNPRITNGCRVRALQCVLQLFNDDLIEELTKENVSAIREKLRLLVYLSELEGIGFSISGSQLQNGKKDEVARSIFATPKFRHDPHAICVAAELCREYNSWCPNTWQVLLQQMVALRQISYLRHLLPDICCHATISSLPCLPTVWQSCVTFPLAAMTPPLSAEEVNVAIASYHFLLACPVLLQVDLISIAQHFCSIEMPLLALGCLLANPSQDENSRKLADANYGTIKEQLEKYPLVLGHKQITEVLSSYDKR